MSAQKNGPAKNLGDRIIPVMTRTPRPLVWTFILLAGLLQVSWIHVSASPPPGYFLKWSDEFTNKTLNLNNWEYARNGWRNSAYNTSSAVSVTNGCLVITTYTQGGTNFTGFIDTEGKVTNSYGYYEASIEFSNAPGQWSAFWLQSPWMQNVLSDGYLGNTNNNPTNGVETDIFEHIDVTSSGTSYYNGGDSALWWNGYGPEEEGGEVYSSGNLGIGAGFNTYGLLWTTNSYTFYLNGNVTGRSTSKNMISSALQFIRLTSEIESNSWAGTVPPGGYPSLTNSPIKMYVDYVRYYAIPAVPLIYKDVPLQAPVIAGKSFQYSVGVYGDWPLGYHWYHGGVPIPQQTNATFTVAAGPVGSTTFYKVLVTNAWGSAFSSVSTLTSIAPASDYYGNIISGDGPVGYWPLQETNGPATASVETNYGLLGSAGNAYYAITNSPETNVVFKQPSAITGSSDPSVGFYGPSGVNYAFVPHRTAALTLQPPLSLECWLNSTSTAFGDLISQGGQDENGSANWGGIRLSYGGSTSGANLQVYTYTGNGSTADSLGTAAGTLPAGQWNYCVLTYDGTTPVLYINGVAQASGALSEALNDSVPLTIGDGRWTGEGTSRPYNGLIDEVAVYTNVLTPDQVTNHWLAGTTAGSNYVQTILNDQPLLYYRMDCPVYTNPPANIDPVAINYGSAPVNGAYLAGTTPGGAAGPTIPALGTNAVAAQMNGVIDCIDAGYCSAFNVTGSEPMTAMVWFKTYPADGRMQTLMSQGGNSSWALNLAGTSGTVVWDSGAGSTASTNILNDGNWHFAAGVYDGKTNYLYIDGALNSSATAAGSIVGNTNDDVFLGGDPDFILVGNNQRYFAGALAEAAFFTNALSAAQIEAIYQAGTLPPPSETVGWTNSIPSGLQLNWNYGTLQSATNVAGPYSDVTNYSPFIMPITNAAEFYRVREN